MARTSNSMLNGINERYYPCLDTNLMWEGLSTSLSSARLSYRIFVIDVLYHIEAISFYS